MQAIGSISLMIEPLKQEVELYQNEDDTSGSLCHQTVRV